MCGLCFKYCGSHALFLWNDLKTASTLYNAPFHSLNVADLLTPIFNSSDMCWAVIFTGNSYIYCIYRTTSQCLSSYNCTITILYCVFMWRFGLNSRYYSLNCDIVNENVNGHNDHQVVLFCSLPGINQPCYILYFVHMCMALPLWLCQISSFRGSCIVPLDGDSVSTYICSFWVPFTYKPVLVRVCCCSLQHAVTCYRLGLVYLVQQGQRTTQGLTYVTVDHSQPRPINVPNENLDVQYTGVKFDTEAPAV